MPLIKEAINEVRKRANLVEIISETLPLKRQGREFVACCPFHNDDTPSFSVNPEKQIYKCFGCGEGGDVFNFLEKVRGWRFLDALRYLGGRLGIRVDSDTPATRPAVALNDYEYVCTYVYTDLEGNPLHNKTRYKIAKPTTGKRDKTFKQGYYKDGEWVCQKPPTQRFVLYNLPDVEQARTSAGIIFLCEGEKDADNVRNLGLCGTTMCEGANKTWLQDYTDSLVGARCVAICQDNDELGVTHANKVASILTGAGIPVRILSFEPHKDVSDWIAAGGTKIELCARVSNQPLWDPSPPPVPAGSLPSLVSPVKFHFEDRGVVDSDMANAKRFVFYFGDKFHFAKERGWLAYTGTHWEADQKGYAVECAKEVVRRIPDEISVCPQHLRLLLEKHAKKSQSAGALNTMLKTASTVEPITVKYEEFDGPETLMKLNVKNGTIDLRTGELRPHDRSDKFTRVLDVEYAPNAQCPQWLEQLEMSLQDDELIAYIQRFAGYCLTGETGEHAFAYFWGHGANGKSAIIKVFEAILGPYAITTPASTFMQQMYKGIPNDIARMAGARMVSASEVSQKDKLDESLVKLCTGGDKLAARFLRQEFFEFVPQFKILMSGNYKPRIAGDDYGLFRRVHLVPFTFQIPEASRDLLSKVIARLLTEKEGILAWMVRGCLEWQDKRLSPPAAVRAATESWFASRDVTRSFVERCCELPPPGVDESLFFVPAKEFYSAYRTFSQESGFYAANLNQFTEAMVKRGCQQRLIGESLCIVGIRLKGVQV